MCTSFSRVQEKQLFNCAIQSFKRMIMHNDLTFVEYTLFQLLNRQDSGEFSRGLIIKELNPQKLMGMIAWVCKLS